MPRPVILIAAGMLILGALPLPYGYYELLRIVATIVLVWAAIVSHSRQHAVLPWTFALLAILFNPIFKVHLPKELWSVIDMACGILLVIFAPSISSNGSSNKAGENGLS